MFKEDPKTEKPSDGVKTCNKIMGIKTPEVPKPDDKKRLLTFDDDLYDIDGLVGIEKLRYLDEAPNLP